MRLTRVSCSGFRRLADTDITPGSRINLIYGANAQGKTSLLEAIMYAATTRSHRTASDDELVCHGADAFHVVIEAETRVGHTFIEAHWWRYAKRFKVNGAPQKRLSDILGKICVVFFAPEDIALVKGSAANRRLFMDMELSQLMPSYLRALQHYRQYLRQRNELLRCQCEDDRQLAPWEIHLAQHGAALMHERENFIRDLSKIAEELYARTVAEEPLELKYRPDISEPDAIERVLGDTRKSDLIRKSTGRGPHRDDVEILISGKPVRAFGSQGQQKSVALIVKLSEVELMCRRMGEYPVVLLDEALAELDANRAAQLMRVIPSNAQTLITTAQPALLPDFCRAGCRMFFIEEGRLEEKSA